MTFLDPPAWLWALLAGESAALGVLTYRFGARGLAWGVLAALGFWCALSLGGSFLISRLEGSRPGNLLLGAVIGLVRIAVLAAPMGLAASGLGALARKLTRR